MKDLLQRLGYAVNGFTVLIKEERSFQLQIITDIFAITVSLILQLSEIEWVFIFATIFMAWSMEALNSSIERLADINSPEENPIIKQVKDLSAAGVFFTLLIAVTITILIWFPKILHHI